MAIGITQRRTLYSNTDATSYTATGGSIYTPGNNSLLVVFFILSHATAAADPTSPTAHGVSLTALTLTNNQIVGAGQDFRISVWVADTGSSPTSTTVATGALGYTATGC